MDIVVMNVSDLRGILQYIPRFRDRIFVISIDGAVAASENFANLLLDIAVLRSLNIRVVLVHGAGHQIEQLAAARSASISNSDGTGPTDAATLALAIEAATRLTNDIMQGLTSVDLRAVYANAIVAHPAGIISGVDFEFTGKVEKIDVHSLRLFLDDGIVPVIPPLGFDGEGRTYRVNSDAVAMEVAEALRAAKILFLFPDANLIVEGEPVRHLSVQEAETLLRKKISAQAGQVSKLEYAARACRHGIPRVHLLNGHRDEALLTEIFSNEGDGTMIYSNEYQQIRRVMKKDVRAVMALIRQSVADEELIRRTRSEVQKQLEDYWILEVDRNIVGCVALHPYPDEGKAELACLYVSRGHENQGYGRKLMAFVEEKARERGIKTLFALSTQAFAYLRQKGGFTEGAPDVLPAARRKKYEVSGRKSKILSKELGHVPLRPGKV